MNNVIRLLLWLAIFSFLINFSHAHEELHWTNISVQIQDGLPIAFITSFQYPDGKSGFFIHNLSNPLDIGVGENTMILHGKLMMPSFESESFINYLGRHGVKPRKISAVEAQYFDDPKRWVWYNNTFYEVTNLEPEDPQPHQFSENYLFQETPHSYLPPGLALPEYISVMLMPETDPLQFSLPHIKPIIRFIASRNPSFDRLGVSYQYNGENRDYNVSYDEGEFLFEKTISTQSQNLFLLPFETYTAQITNITPPVIVESSLPISIEGEDSSFEGTAQFERDKISLEFKRKISNKILMIFLALLSILIPIFTFKEIRRRENSSDSMRVFVEGLAISVSLIFTALPKSIGLNLITILILIVNLTCGFLLIKDNPKKKI